MSAVAAPDAVTVERYTHPPGTEELAHVVPLLTSALPLVPGATNWTALVPLPRITLLAVSVDAPVPPMETGRIPLEFVRADLPAG